MSAAQSPLFEPVLWHGRGFEILDEIQVPEKIEYIQVTEVAQALDAVRDMKTRAFGQVLTFLYSGALVAQNYSGVDAAPLSRSLSQMTEQFCAARPTFDFRGLGSYFEEWCKKLPQRCRRRRNHRAPGARVGPADRARAPRAGQARSHNLAKSGAAC